MKNEPTTVTPRVLADLVAARARLVGHFGKGAFYDHETKCFCTAGAVLTVVGGGAAKTLYAVDQRALAALWQLARQVPDNHFTLNPAKPLTPITQFNDRNSTTEADALALYDRAIKHVQEVLENG